MVTEQAIITNTETDREAVSAMVLEAFQLWSSDSTNEETARRMSNALDEAYLMGVRISVKFAQAANGSTPDVNEQVYKKLIKSDPWIQKEIVISTVQDNPDSRICRGEVIAGPFSSFLSLDVIEDGKRLNIMNLKPNNIILLTPIITSE